MFDCFRYQKNVASFNIDFNIFLKAWQIIFINNKLSKLIKITIKVCQNIN